MPQGNGLPVPVELKTEALSLLEESKLVQPITDDKSYVIVGYTLVNVKKFIAKGKDFFKPMKKAADENKKRILDAEKLVLGPAEEASRLINMRLVEYDQEKKSVAEIERAKREQEARKREEEQRLARAVELENEGRGEEALATLDRPQEVSVPPVEATPKVEGLSYRETWSAEIYDFQALVAFVSQHPTMLNLLFPNEPALNAMARAQRSAMDIPGVRPHVTRTAVGKG